MGDARAPHTVSYTIIHNRMLNNRQDFIVPISKDEIEHLVNEGFFLLQDFASPSELERIRTAIDRIAEEERNLGDLGCVGGQYLRYLMDKDQVFLDFYKLETTRSIARAVLGPQVQFDQVDARVIPGGKIGVQVPWHIHMKAVPKPLPPFFCYPHAIHCLLYLDKIDATTGPICVLPGSHRNIHYDLPADDFDDKPGQRLIYPEAGSCLVMHCNLWHRTLPSLPSAGPRRVIIFGYMAPWMKGEEKGGFKPLHSLRDNLMKTADDQTREILGEFYWR